MLRQEGRTSVYKGLGVGMITHPADSFSFQIKFTLILYFSNTAVTFGLPATIIYLTTYEKLKEVCHITDSSSHSLGFLTTYLETVTQRKYW
jgi:hypothetical protein